MSKQVITIVVSLLLFLQLATPMNSAKDLAAMVKRQATAWETQDPELLIGDFAEDALFLAAGFKFQGRAAIQKAAEDYFRNFTDTEVTIKRIILEKNQGAVEWDWRDRKRKTNQLSAAEDAIIFELNDDSKIVYWREYIEKKKVVSSR